jgi:hypothetical protein
MPSLLIQAPQEGINTSLPDSLISPREAGRRSQNILYENGYITTPCGFARVDITTGLDVEFGGAGTNTNVLNIFPFKELDGYEHLMAVTGTKIYEHDRVNNDWNDLTQSGLTMVSQFPNPVSFTSAPNNYGPADDNRIHLNDDTAQSQAYFHLLVSNGGLNNIQRWAGRFETDFADLTMTAGDYGGATQTTHRAFHVSSFRSRIILLSPQNFDSTTNLWTENNQQLRWNVINKPQTWNGTGSGSVTLIDTGGTNMWAAPLGGTHIIYQSKGIWDLNYVGGTTVFDPRPMVPDLGLLAPHLLTVKNNVHYFVGDDFNVYAYFGGTVKERLGDKIHPLLQAELSSEFASRSWMAFGPDNKRLWIFIVPEGEQYATKAIGLDIRTGAWQVKDFKDLYTTTTGITSVNLVGSQSFTTGDSYNTALETLSPYLSDTSKQTAGDTTIRYGDVLRGDTTENVLDQTFDFSDIVPSAGGLTFDVTLAGAGADITTDLYDTILRIDDGSDSSNMPYGSHYYHVESVCADTDGTAYIRFTVCPRGADSTGTGIADNSSNTPVLAAGTTATFFDASGATYRESISETLKKATLMFGDNSGFVYEFDPTNSTYDGATITARHVTHVEDYNEPDLMKRWSKISVVARANPDNPTNGGLKVRHRLANFDTSDTGWRGDFTQDLTTSWKNYDFFNNRTSREIQYEFDSAAGSNFQISQYKISEPQIQNDR